MRRWLVEAGIPAETLETHMAKLVENAGNDSAMTVGLRFPEDEEIEKVLRYMYEGKSVDF